MNEDEPQGIIVLGPNDKIVGTVEVSPPPEPDEESD
jgi:hypothetical protein